MIIVHIIIYSFSTCQESISFFSEVPPFTNYPHSLKQTISTSEDLFNSCFHSLKYFNKFSSSNDWQTHIHLLSLSLLPPCWLSFLFYPTIKFQWIHFSNDIESSLSYIFFNLHQNCLLYALIKSCLLTFLVIIWIPCMESKIKLYSGFYFIY